MIERKKAQIGTTLSWFVATLIIFFILFVFLIFGFGRVGITRLLDGKSSILIEEISIFDLSEQQRNLFIFFESEFEEKDNYQIVGDLVEILHRRRYSHSLGEEYRFLDSALEFYSEKQKKDGLCINLTIVDDRTPIIEQTEGLHNIDLYREYREKGGTASGFTHAYYRFPKPRPIFLEKMDIPRSPYKFFFPEKSFALIEFFQTKCPQEEKR